MTFFHHPKGKGGEDFKSAQGGICQERLQEKFLHPLPRLQPGLKIVFPLPPVGIFQLMPSAQTGILLKVSIDGFPQDLSAMNGHSHPVSAQWRDHAGSIPAKKDVIFYQWFLLEGHLIDDFGRLGQKLSMFIKVPEEGILK